jgi:hypothetical protein
VNEIEIGRTEDSNSGLKMLLVIEVSSKLLYSDIDKMNQKAESFAREDKKRPNLS